MTKVNPIPEELVIKRLRLENPWWENGCIPADVENMKRRIFYHKLYEQVLQKQVRRAIVLMGPRRVGKTILLYHVISGMLQNKTPRHKICYISIDAPIYNNTSLEDLFALCRKAVGDDNPEGYTVFFDEVQYLKDWERHLKSIVDFFPKTRFVVSGSAAAALKLKSDESGAGRFTDFLLPPLTFEEYITLKGLDNLAGLLNTGKDDAALGSMMDELNQHFIDYINYGGYPEVIFSDAIQEDPGKYIRSDIIDKVLLRDLPSLYGIRDVQELNSLFNVIAYNCGNEFNIEGLSQQSGVDKNTIRKYLEYLEAAFLIKRLYPVGINSKRFMRDTRFKIYLTNPSMRCALFAPIAVTDEHMGQMVETAIICQMLHFKTLPMHYAAWQGGEVDLVFVNALQKPVKAIEIKWSNQYVKSPGKLKSLIKYCKENNLKEATVTSISSRVAEVVVADIKMAIIQGAVYCYTLGSKELQFNTQ